MGRKKAWSAWLERREDLEILLRLYDKGIESVDDTDDEELKQLLYNYGTIDEYGLCFEWVDMGEDESFFRYQISTGGPGEEINFFVNIDYKIYRAEFWYLDWRTAEYITITRSEVTQRLWDYLTYGEPEMALRHLIEEAQKC